MNDEKDISYLGKGWSFPPSFDKISGETVMVVNEEDIKQSLEILLSTRPGERVMQPGFGCNLDVMLFESITTTLITYVKDLVRKSILFHEARIDVDDIKIDIENVLKGLILIKVDYTLRSTNSRFNFVYPFYLEEATNINKGV